MNSPPKKKKKKLKALRALKGSGASSEIMHMSDMSYQLLKRLVSITCMRRRYGCRDHCRPRAGESLGQKVAPERCRYIYYPQGGFLLVVMSRRSSRRNTKSECPAAALAMKRMSIADTVRGEINFRIIPLTLYSWRYLGRTVQDINAKAFAPWRLSASSSSSPFWAH